jgi:hypothetical protein
MRVESTVPSNRLSIALRHRNAAVEGSHEDGQALRDCLRVSLSALGKARSAAAQKNRDIDESSLPDGVKQTLKMIRALKAQIAQKKAELTALMADQGLDADTRRLRIEALQGELASLQGALSSASAMLLKAVREQGLSAQQMQEVATLSIN